jgi:hypothetical protein
MDVLTISFVTACAALVSAAAGPLASVVVASRHARVSLISGNRERWIEALRDSIADYVAIALSAAALQEARQEATLAAVRDDPELWHVVEGVARARTRVLLMLNPAEAVHLELSAAIDRSYRVLTQGAARLETIAPILDALTSSARSVLKAEWSRVKRGE